MEVVVVEVVIVVVMILVVNLVVILDVVVRFVGKSLLLALVEALVVEALWPDFATSKATPP